MANLPQSLSLNAPFGGPSASATSSAAAAGGAPANKDRKMASAEHLVLELSNPDLRENALLELSKVIIAIFWFLIDFWVVEVKLNSGFVERLVLFFCY